MVTNQKCLSTPQINMPYQSSKVKVQGMSMLHISKELHKRYGNSVEEYYYKVSIKLLIIKIKRTLMESIFDLVKMVKES